MPESTVPGSTGHTTITTETRTFAADRHEAGKIDAWIEAVGRRWSESPRTIFGARLCVAELFNNVIEHGGAKSGGDHVIVMLARCGDGMEVEFLDAGARFDPTGRVIAEQSDSAGSSAISGRGLMLIRTYAKELAYRHDGTYNRVTLKIGRRPS